MSSPNADFASARADISASANSLRCPDHPHAAAAAAGRGLEDQWIADLDGQAGRFALASGVAVGAGNDRDAEFLGGAFGGDLIAHQPDVFGTGSDEMHLVLGEDLGEAGILGEEAIAGVHRVGAGDLAGGEESRDVEIAVLGGGRADADALVGQADMHRVFIGGGMHRDRGNSELLAGAQHAKRDFSPIGDEDFVEHHSTISSGWPYSTGCPSSTRIWITVPARGAGI